MGKEQHSTQPMKKILIIFAHPRFEQSRTNKILLQYIQDLEGVTIHDLYEHYPDFYIDVEYEQQLLQSHDVIVWHHPMYWYNCPPLMKQWMDMVLEYGWAYGPGGDALESKVCMHILTTGGSKAVYCSAGKHHFTLNEFLRPFEQTALLCGMEYLTPFAVMGTHQITDEEIERAAGQYRMIIDFLRKDKQVGNLKQCSFHTDIFQLKKLYSE